MSYDLLLKSCKDPRDRDKRILVIGAGFIAKEYCRALACMGVSRITVVARSEKSARECVGPYGFSFRHGGYTDCGLDAREFDLAVVALPIHELRPAVEFLLDGGARTILVEKPASLYSGELEEWARSAVKRGARIRVAYNRMMYPNLWKLRGLVDEDGGITSCRYTFTEWVHTIDFKKERDEVYRRWGISNSLHVISMAHALIGMPVELFPLRSGAFPWHPSGSRFVGSGTTERGIPFSYHADWGSAGRWGIEIMTNKNAYQLIPLEDLFRCRKGTVMWEKVEFEKAYPEAKQGLVEEITVMLNAGLEDTFSLPDLRYAHALTKLAENIFGYSEKS